MKKIFFILLITTSSLCWGQSTEVKEIRLSDVVEKVSVDNYSVYQNSLRVYQAKESITIARMNLLPRLNLWNLASSAIEIFAGGPTGAVAGAFSIVEDIAPFLVPANWFRIGQNKLFYKADLEGYKALWSNEVYTAKALYHHILLDSSLKEHILKSKKELENIHQIVRVREVFGGSSQGVSQEIKIRLLALDEDLHSLNVLIAEEEGYLAYLMGFPAGTKLKLQSVEMPDFNEISYLDYEDFEFRALDVSPEVKQFDFFIEASSLSRKEITYAFLGSSSVSRGLNGGMFDSLPAQIGLGFGTAASVRVSRAQKEILKAQREAVAEVVRTQLNQLINSYNFDVDNFKNQKLRVQLAKESLALIYQRIQFGERVESLQLIEASRNVIDADTSLFSVMYRFLNSEDKLARLIFHGDYAKAQDVGAILQGVKP